VWKTVREEFLRKEKSFGESICDGWITYYHVYALHQVSLTTQNTRIVEDWRLA